MPPVPTLKTRAEFQRAARGQRRHGRYFTAQAQTPHQADGTDRIGYTVTRKVGTATERNRIRRRLRAAAAEALAGTAGAGLDLVIIARREVLGAEYRTLVHELKASRSVLAQRLGRAAPQGAGAQGSR